MSAPWLLTIGERTGQLQPGLYERIVASYARRGVSFEQFLVEEEEQPKQKRRKTDRDGGGGSRESLVSLFRPPRKAAGRGSSSHDAAESSEAAEGEPEARVPIPAPSEGDAVAVDEADGADDGVEEAASSELWVKGSKVEALDGPGTWYEASVVDERGHGEAREYLVHYKGWKARYDEWMGPTLTLTLTSTPTPTPTPTPTLTRYDEWMGVDSGRLRAAGSGELGPCKRVAAAATAAKMEGGSRAEALAQDPSGMCYQASDVQVS